MWDVGDLDDPEVIQVSENDNATFDGTWSNYLYSRQKGTVAVSSIGRGLFILQPRVDRTGN